MSDRLTVILPPVLTAEGRIAEALDYSSFTEGDGYGVGYGSVYGSGSGSGDGYGTGYGGGDGTGRGDGKSSVHTE
jgi:hypothetical protein